MLMVGGRTEDIHFFFYFIVFTLFFPVYLYSLPQLISYNCFLLKCRYNLILRFHLFMIHIFKVISLNVRSVVLSASWTGSKGWWWLGKNIGKNDLTSGYGSKDMLKVSFEKAGNKKKVVSTPQFSSVSFN